MSKKTSSSKGKNRREFTAFKELSLMGKYLPRIRAMIQKMMKSKDAQRRYHGALLYLVDNCGFRRGYISNKNKGVITLESSNFDFESKSKKGCSDIDFIGKHRQKNSCTVCNPTVNRILRQSIKKNLLEKNRSVKLNQYLHTIHKGLKTKAFRTWIATVAYIEAVNKLLKEHKKEYVNRMALGIKATDIAAKTIFNMPKNAYRFYIHPKVVDRWMQTGKPFQRKGPKVKGLSDTEVIVKEILESS